MLTEDGFSIATFAVSDLYGDYGVTGLVIFQLEAKEKVVSIDTLLMSCRVIGRNVERAFFDYLVDKLRIMGVLKLQAEYLRTSKNDQVSGFYDSLGFNVVATETFFCRYELMLADYRQSEIDYIKVNENVNGKNL
jgi:FkbH-like protein